MKLKAAKPRYVRSKQLSRDYGIWYVPKSFFYLRVPWRTLSLDWQKKKPTIGDIEITIGDLPESLKEEA